MGDLDELAARVGPLFTAAQAGDQRIAARTLSSRPGVRRLAPGLYVVAAAWDARRPDEQQRLLARWAQERRPSGVVSHHTAAAVHGLPLPPSGAGHVCLTVTRGRTVSSPVPVRLEPGRLAPERTTTIDGLVVTTPARTVADCLRTMPLPDGVAIADAALARGLVTYPELERERHDQRRWPGVGRVDLGLWLSDPARESWLESASFVTLWRHGVPLPEHQTVVFDETGRFVARVDGLWREAGVVGEVDGVEKYLGGPQEPASVEVAQRELLKEERRQRALEALGLTVVRWGISVRHDERERRVRDAMLSARPELVIATYESHPRSRHDWRATVVQPPLERRNRRRPT